ncbi:MAG TPA: hypothetical protein PLN52_19285 [Opitutaceae bacterium]|nr:hypothetical protein [Opitutaceae bacterium]
MTPIVGIAFVLIALGTLMVAVKALQQRGVVRAEGSRKAVHIGMGTICLGFPWIFHDVWPVWILGALALLMLGSVRLIPTLKRGVGGVLHDVNRASLGELCFPVGVATVFTLAQGDPLLFVIPVALLTFADAAGAMIGTRWGKNKYVTLEGTKSIEGSLAVGLTGMLVTVIPLLAGGHNLVPALLIGAAIGLFALNLEAVSWHGLDNVFLPLAVYAQITVHLEASAPVLAANLSVLFVLTVIALVWRRGQIVDESSRLGCALALYFFWTVGGPEWLIAPLVLLFSYVRLMPVAPRDMPRHNLVAVLCVSSACLVWAVAEAFAPHPRWLALFTLSTATHQAMIAIVRLSQGRPHWNRVGWWSAGVIQAILTQGLAYSLIEADQPGVLRTIAFGSACLALAAATFTLIERQLQAPENLKLRWWKQGTVAFLASACGLLLFHL